jgi:hypothetical protein
VLVLDAGALIALDRNDRDMWAMLRVAAAVGDTVVVPAGVVAQAWRDGRRQALLAKALQSCREVALDGAGARAAGLLCGYAGTSDVIDASVALAVAGAGGGSSVTLLTSDPSDLRRLLEVLRVSPNIVVV